MSTITSKRYRTFLLTGGILTLMTLSLVSLSYIYNPIGDRKLSTGLDGDRQPVWGTSQRLKEDQFTNRKQYFYSEPEKSRYESVDAWRSPDSFVSTYPSSEGGRPSVAHWSKFTSKGQYLKQPLAADYADGADKIFLMIKTGGDVLWKRLPVHLFTTLTRVPNFALYADKPGSIGGYEVIDILANVSAETYKSEVFSKYRKTRFLHDHRYVIDASEVNIDGGWELDKFKNIPMLNHAYHSSPTSDWFVFMDADSYIMMDTLTNWLKTLDPDQPLYMGSAAMYGDLMFGHGGSVVVVSRKALELTLGQHPEYVEEYEREAFKNCCGDVIVGQMLRDKIDVKLSHGTDYPHVGYRFQGNSHYDFAIQAGHWCHPIVSFHHITPHDIELLWEYEKLRGPTRDSITYSDMYRDFYLPYITEELAHWDNYASEREWKPNSPANDGADVTGDTPNSSLEACKTACKEWDSCLSYRYITDRKTCGLSSSIKLGKPTVDWMGKDLVDTTSGWMIERIRDIRRQNSCDDLYHDTTEAAPDGTENDNVEGWYHRRAQKEGIYRHDVGTVRP
jgi:hypothetical protein